MVGLHDLGNSSSNDANVVTWLTIVELLLKLADAAYTAAEKQGLIQEGDDRATLRALLALQQRTAAYKAIQQRVDVMTPEAVAAELEKQGDYRD